MSEPEELVTCELICSPSEAEALNNTGGMDYDQPIFSMLSGGMKVELGPNNSCDDGGVDCGGVVGGGGEVVVASPTATTSDTESGIFSGECELCVEHESELDWFCATEQKIICSHCAIVGSCHGHTVTPLATRVTTVRVSA